MIGRENTPPYDQLNAFLIPDAPYARGGHHFTNGATWIEQFAEPLGLAGNARPAFARGGLQAANYAVGGARARDDGMNVNLSTQVSNFLADFSGAAPPAALYVVEMGTNDVGDALAAFASGADGGPIIAAALTAIGGNLTALYAAGARKFMVASVPNIGLTPAIRALDVLNPGAAQTAGLLTQTFNSNLDALLSVLQAGLPGSVVARLDVYERVNSIVANPQAFGLSEVTDPCITPLVSPFACLRPDHFLFWDGIHPTKVVHAIFAQEAARALAQ